MPAGYGAVVPDDADAVLDRLADVERVGCADRQRVEGVSVSAREPFVRYIEGADRLFINGVERTDPSDSAADTCAAINAAHADRVAAELEAAADERAGIAGDDNVCRWLRARAKAIREGWA